MKDIITIYLKILKNTKFLIIIILSMIYTLLNFTLPYINGKIIDTLVAKNVQSLISIIIVFVVISVVAILINYINTVLINKAQITLSTKMKEQTINKITKTFKESRERITPSEFQGRISEINSVENLLSQNIYKLFTSVIALFLVLIYFSTISYVLTIFMIIISPLYYYLNKKSFKELNTSAIQNAQGNIMMLGQVSSFYTILDFLKFNKLLKVFHKNVINDNTELSMKKYDLLSKSNKTINIISLLNFIVTALLIILMSTYFFKGYISIGQYVSVFQYFTYVTSPLILLSTINVSVQPGIVAYRRNQEFNESLKEMDDCPDNANLIEIESVVIDNPKYDNRISTNFQYELSSGDHLKVSGSNGSGKSTLFKLITKQYVTDKKGSIKINNIGIEDLSYEQLADNVHYFEQETVILNKTILENIEIETENFLSKINSDTSSSIYKLYQELTNQFQNNVLDNSLSLGEKKKIALLRLYNSSKAILLLDEPEASLDEKGVIILSEIISIKKEEGCIILQITHHQERE